MTSLATRPPAARAVPGASRASLALALACGGTFLSFLDATVTNLAVPAVGAEFTVGVAALAWLVTAYAIPFAALLAPAGALADAVGRVRLYLGGVGLFSVASLLAVVAPSYEVLVGARVLQGVGAALLVPASLGLLLAEVPAERRQAAIGLWSATGAIAAGAGPVLGGLAVDWIGWRALFCINLPIGAWLLWRGRALLAGEQRTGRAPELGGSLLLAIGVAGLVHGLTEVPERGWDGYVLAVFAVAAVALAGAVARGLRHRRPALRIDLLRGRTFAIASAVSVGYGAVLYAPMLVAVLLLTGPWRYSPLGAGLALTPTCAVVAVVAIAVGRLPRKPSPRVLASAGMALMALAAGLISLGVEAEPELWSLWIPTGVVLGLGTGLATVGISSAAALSVAPLHFAAATGLVMAARQVGGALGVAASAVVLAEVAGPARPFEVVYLGFAGVAVLAALGALGLGAVAGTAGSTTAAPAVAAYDAEAADRWCLDPAEAARMLADRPWRRLVVMGDSVTAGIREARDGYRDQSFSERLATALSTTRPHFSWTNLATPSLTAAQIRDEQLARALELEPDIVVVCAGANDCLGRTYDARAVEKDLAALLVPLARSGALVVTIGLFDLPRSGLVPPERAEELADRFDELDRITVRLVERIGGVHVDTHHHPLAADPGIYSSDRVHANARGHAVAFAAIARTLAGDSPRLTVSRRSASAARTERRSS